MLVAERRWNLRLKNGIDVRCRRPTSRRRSNGWSTLDREKKLLTRDIVADRSAAADRVTVRLSDAAAQARAEALKEKKPAKKGRRRMSPSSTA